MSEEKKTERLNLYGAEAIRERIKELSDELERLKYAMAYYKVINQQYKITPFFNAAQTKMQTLHNIMEEGL